MIVWDLDGTLADCEHRRHLVDPNKNNEYKQTMFISDCKEHIKNPILDECGMFQFPRWVNIETGMYFKPDWKAFYEACDKDEPIESVFNIFHSFMFSAHQVIQIWSGRCESVKEKTQNWLCQFMHRSEMPELKMRPVGDYTPDEVLKEKWLNERCSDLIEAAIEGKNPVKHDIDFVFDSHKRSIEMWRRRGIFVFNCCQHDGEF